MPIPINWPGFSQTAQKLFGLKGRIPLAFDETVVPIYIVESGPETPWSGNRSCGNHKNQAAVALNFAIVGVQPVTGVYLRVESIWLENTEAAAARMKISVYRPSQIAAITENARTNLVDYTAPVDPLGASGRVGSVIVEAEHTVSSGVVIWRGSVGIGEAKEVVLRQPIFLDGNAKGGIGMLAVISENVNEGIGAAFFCREYVDRS